MKILLVDDTPSVLEVITAQLSVLGHTVEAVSEPKHALRVFRENANDLNVTAFDLVITDFGMPVWSGLTLSMHLRDACRAYELPLVPIICLSGACIADIRRMNERDGSPIQLVIAKPIELADLANAIKCATERAQVKAAGAS